MRQTIAKAKRLAYRAILFYGHPDYYPRFGFTQASRFGLACPFPVPEASFMAMELDPGALADKHGQVVYAPEFQSSTKSKRP